MRMSWPAARSPCRVTVLALSNVHGLHTNVGGGYDDGHSIIHVSGVLLNIAKKYNIALLLLYRRQL